MPFYIHHPDHRKEGPFSHEDLWRLRDTGTISDQTLVWETGTPGWVPLAEILNGKKVTPAPQPILRHQTGKRPKHILAWFFWGTIVIGVAGYASYALHLFPGMPAKEEQLAITPWTEEEKQVLDEIIRGFEEGSLGAELFLAIRNGTDVNICIQSGELKGFTALMIEAVGGHTDIVRMLLDKGANPNACLQSEEGKGYTALMFATEGGRTDIVRMLLDKGANPNACDQSEEFKGRTALMAAAVGGHTDIARMLLDKGADPNACFQSEEGKGYTALIFAAQEGHTDIARILLDKGANPNASEQSEKGKGITALIKATIQGHTDIVRMLLDKGANPNASVQSEEGKGYTALMGAAGGGHADIARMLLDKGAAPNACDQSEEFKGRTALMAAAVGGHTDIACMLLDKGADPKAKIISGKDKGQTAMMLASRKNHTEIVRLLQPHDATPVPRQEHAPFSQPPPPPLDSRFFPACFSPLPSTLPGILSACLKQMESAPDNISDDDRVLLRKTATALKQLLESLDRVDKAVTDGTAAMQEAAQMDRRAQNSPEQTAHRLMVQADGKREQARDTWSKATADYRKALQTIETLGQSMLAQNREHEGKALLRTVEEFREKDRDAEEARKEQKRQQAPDSEEDVPTLPSPARRKARDISGWGF